ncbi:biotin transporter BioY [Achromobacter spanius]|uniref:biotin transporter BioY n=1 Tax=Achromobacter spanius TaxID=217203 RepID=UPI003207ABC0
MKSNNTVLVALFAALIVVLSLMPPIPMPGIPVPITLQTLGAMLAGAMLGPVRGALACLLYLALAAVGLPVLPGGRGGLGAFFGPTGGFLVGMVAGAFVTGWLARRLAVRASGTWMGLAGYVAAWVASRVERVWPMLGR